MAATEHAIELTHLAAQAAADKLATDLVAFDVSERFPLADVFLIASAPNERAVGAVVDSVEEALFRAGTKALRSEGGGVEGVDLRRALGQEGDVHAVGGLRRAAVVRALDPELGEGAAVGHGLVLGQVQHALNAQGGEHGVVEGHSLLEAVGAERDVRQG